MEIGAYTLNSGAAIKAANWAMKEDPACAEAHQRRLRAKEELEFATRHEIPKARTAFDVANAEWRRITSEVFDRVLAAQCLSSLASFPCNEDKSPMTLHGFKDARHAEWQSPLVGVPTGEVNGFDVLDVDPKGEAWLNGVELPLTRCHWTRRGRHFLFRHAAGLRNSEGRIAPGVDVRAEGGYVIWWPRQGFRVDSRPLCEWPGWLLKEAMEPTVRSRVDPRSYSHPGISAAGGDVKGASAALRKLDPGDFVGDRARWLALMNGAKAVGVPLEVFCEWTSGQDHYERNDEEVARNWWSLRAEHPGAFYAELSAAGVRLHGDGGGRSLTPRVHPGTSASTSFVLPKTINFYARVQQARGPLQRAQGEAREQRLFEASCVFAEMIAEGRLAMKTARDLLMSDCHSNRLWKEDKELCLRTIGRAFRHVEEKILKDGDSNPAEPSNGELRNG